MKRTEKFRPKEAAKAEYKQWRRKHSPTPLQLLVMADLLDEATNTGRLMTLDQAYREAKRMEKPSDAK